MVAQRRDSSSEETVQIGRRLSSRVKWLITTISIFAWGVFSYSQADLDEADQHFLILAEYISDVSPGSGETSAMLTDIVEAMQRNQYPQSPYYTVADQGYAPLHLLTQSATLLGVDKMRIIRRQVVNPADTSQFRNLYIGEFMLNGQWAALAPGVFGYVASGGQLLSLAQIAGNTSKANSTNLTRLFGVPMSNPKYWMRWDIHHQPISLTFGLSSYDVYSSVGKDLTRVLLLLYTVLTQFLTGLFTIAAICLIGWKYV